VRVAALCDVDESQFAGVARDVEARQQHSPMLATDFRRLLEDPALDAVVIATPDHWHAPLLIASCQAEKDIYLEVPVSHSLDEGAAMRKAVAKSRRVVQAGLQQRSGEHFRTAVEYLRSGKLGMVHMAKAWTVHQRRSIGIRKPGEAPAGVDYDMWLGPAAPRAFHPNRFHHNWHWFWDYGSGELGNWGVHLLDVARWGLDVEFPTQVSAVGGKHHFRDDQQTPDTLAVTYGFRDKIITWEHRLWSPHGQEGRSAAVAFCGERGTLIVDRGGWKVYGQKDSASSTCSDLLQPHLRNFIDCVKSRAEPTCPLDIGETTSALCHFGNLAYRLGRSLEVNPQTPYQLTDPAAKQLTMIERREPWGIG
jgi:predicted dehydrogenase